MRRLERLQARRIDESVITAKMANEGYWHIQDTEAVRYAIGAMQPIDPEYTANTFRQGDRVRDQLRDRLSSKWLCEFDYQGSTTNDTHIKARSDIDLLVFLTLWFWVEPPLVNDSPYQGDWRADIRQLRHESEQAVQDAFPKATADISGANAIKLEGGSLTRRVDVVPATWSSNQDYINTENKIFRGVKIYDKKTGEFLLNRPFLYNYCVDEKDRRTLGGMRKAARLMKSLAYDTKSPDMMRSYNITSIAWNIPDRMLAVGYPHELRIVEVCREYCGELRKNSHLRGSIRVPDDSRGVFDGNGGATLSQLDNLIAELDGLIRDIFAENARSYHKLAEAKVEYSRL